LSAFVSTAHFSTRNLQQLYMERGARFLHRNCRKGDITLSSRAGRDASLHCARARPHYCAAATNLEACIEAGGDNISSGRQMGKDGNGHTDDAMEVPMKTTILAVFVTLALAASVNAYPIKAVCANSTLSPHGVWDCQ
jgi:hypothetical protein